MCTVSYVPSANQVLLAHSRDEAVVRKMALVPKIETIKHCRLLFPKDGTAGGSWIACNEFGGAVVLLNGAFNNHIPRDSYQRSRGLVLLDIAASANMLGSFEELNLEGIEPFTVIMIEAGHLVEARWDGHKKHVCHLPADQPHSWSSVTLYQASIAEKRKTWFTTWLAEGDLSVTALLQFHLFGGEGDIENDIRMNRAGTFLTVSVTAIELKPELAIMHYIDLQQGGTSINKISHRKTPVEVQS